MQLNTSDILRIGVRFGILCLFLFTTNSYGNPLSKEYIYFDFQPPELWMLRRLPIYEKPNGETVGSFKLVATNSWCLVEWKYKDQKHLPQEHDLYWADLCGNLVIYDEVNDFYNVLNNSIPGGVWVQKVYNHPTEPNLAGKGKPRKIIDTIQRSASFGFGGYIGLTLREGPSHDSPPVVTLGENHIVARARSGGEELWAELTVFEVDGYPTYEYQNVVYQLECPSAYSWKPFVKKEYRGWIKALRDDGITQNISWGGRC